MTATQIDTINGLAATAIMGWFDNLIFPSLHWHATATERAASKADWRPYSVQEQAEMLLGRLPVVDVFFRVNDDSSGITCFLLVTGGEGALRGTRTVTGSGPIEAAALTMACLRAFGVDLSEFRDKNAPEMPLPGCVMDEPLIFQYRKGGGE